jgi:hypothetical protein
LVYIRNKSLVSSQIMASNMVLFQNVITNYICIWIRQYVFKFSLESIVTMESIQHTKHTHTPPSRTYTLCKQTLRKHTLHKSHHIYYVKRSMLPILAYICRHLAIFSEINIRNVRFLSLIMWTLNRKWTGDITPMTPVYIRSMHVVLSQ